MQNNKTVSLTISLPKNYRDLVRIKAAECNIDHPEDVMTGARIVRDIVIEYLDGWLKGQEESSQRKNNVQSQSKEKTQ